MKLDGERHQSFLIAKHSNDDCLYIPSCPVSIEIVDPEDSYRIETKTETNQNKAENILHQDIGTSKKKWIFAINIDVVWNHSLEKHNPHFLFVSIHATRAFHYPFDKENEDVDKDATDIGNFTTIRT